MARKKKDFQEESADRGEESDWWKGSDLEQSEKLIGGAEGERLRCLQVSTDTLSPLSTSHHYWHLSIQHKSARNTHLEEPSLMPRLQKDRTHVVKC